MQLSRRSKNVTEQPKRRWQTKYSTDEDENFLLATCTNLLLVSAEKPQKVTANLLVRAYLRRAQTPDSGW
jgi:hypothetical protein